MALEQAIILAAVVLAIAFDVWLMRRLRSYWRRHGVGSGQNQQIVQLLGSFSPVLTWLKYRRLPEAAWPQFVAVWLRRQTWLVNAVGAGACLLALVGQQQLLLRLGSPVVGYVLFAGAIALFLMTVRMHASVDGTIGLVSQGSSTGCTSWMTHAPVRAILIASTLGLSLVNVLLIDSRKDSDSYWDTFVLWIASLVLYLVALSPVSVRSRSLPERARWTFILLVGLIILIAFGLRFYGLGRVPPVMENDEALVGRETIAVLEGRLTNMFRTFRSYGTLEFFAMAVPVGMLGPAMFALRWLSAVEGWLAIPMLVVFAKRLFGARVALVSATLLTVSHLDIHFSHVSVTASTFDPLLITLSLYLVYRALQTRALLTWGLAGLSLGITLYAYAGARVVMLIAAIFLAALVVLDRPTLRRNLVGVLTMAVASILTVVPMIPWIVHNPNSFNARLNSMGIIQSGWLVREAVARGVPAWQVLLEQFRDAMLNLNVYGVGWFYGANVPMLGWLTGALFVLGLTYALICWRDERFMLLNLWFWIPLFLGQILMRFTAGAAYRTLSILPPICIMAAVALVKLVDAVVPQLRHRERWVTAAIVVVLAVEGWWNTHYYFRVWAPSDHYSEPGAWLSTLVADYVRELGPSYQTYVFGTPRFQVKGWAVMAYVADGMRYVDVGGNLPAAMPAIALGQNVAFVFAPERVSELALLERALPGGQRMEHYWGKTLYFVTYELP